MPHPHPPKPRTGVLVITGAAGQWTRHRDTIAHLAALGTPVHLAGHADAADLPTGVQVHPRTTAAGTRSTRPGRVRALLRRATRGRTDEGANQVAPSVFDEVETVLVLDHDTTVAQRLVGKVPEHVRLWSGDAAGEHLEDLLRQRELAALQELDSLVATRQHRTARDLVASWPVAQRSVLTSTATTLMAAVDLSEHGRYSGDLQAMAQGSLTAADGAWARGEGATAIYPFAAAVRLLFHPVLHAEVADPPLAADPRSFLGPLHESQMFRDITTPPGPAPGGDTPPTAPRVLVLTGAYPRFSGPLVQALREATDARVRTTSLGDLDKVFNWLGVNTRALSLRIRAHPSGAGVHDVVGRLSADATMFDDVDVVVADWADRGAMWASMVVPCGVRLVVRLHGIDVMSPWAQFIDWSRVDDTVFVSAPLRDLARAVIGEQLEHTAVHVVEHGVDPAPFEAATAALSRPSPNRDRTLGMIGWGRVVKDPLWTLQVFEHLRDQDPSWRLLLIGHPLERDTDHRARAYRELLQERLDHLGSHIEHVPQTDDVPAHAARMGFIISSSLRESFHLGLLEGVLAGAVPVVRDWPSYQGRTGPEGLFPAHWVVRNTAEAAERIRALADPEARARAAHQARAEARRRFAPEKFAQRVREVVLSR